jgi:glutaconyl-CoA/methylmalonyl-CoA decarboxylase subunit delta
MDLTADPLIVGVQIVVLGVTIVFTALTFVALSLAALGLLNRIPARNAPAPAPAITPPAAAASLPPAAPLLTGDHVTPELIAVLSAAAHEMLGQPVRITRVMYERRPAAWSSQGRITIMNSRRRQK